ncbi:unnamed protein product [Closterium sp. NIES-53]
MRLLSPLLSYVSDSYLSLSLHLSLLSQVRRHLLSGASVVLDRCNMSVEQRAEFLLLILFLPPPLVSRSSFSLSLHLSFTSQVRRHLQSGASVVLDRCNMSVEQRTEFLALARACNVQSHVLVFDLPVALVVQRAVNRVNHEGGVQGPRAASIIRHQMKMREPPAATENFQRVTVCRTDAHVDQALSFYRVLRPSAFAAASGGCGAEGPGVVELQGAGGGILERRDREQRKERERGREVGRAQGVYGGKGVQRESG